MGFADTFPVFCPYTLVKRITITGYEEVDVDAVMDGNLDGFIFAFLSGMKIEINHII